MYNYVFSLETTSLEHSISDVGNLPSLCSSMLRYFCDTVKYCRSVALSKFHKVLGFNIIGLKQNNKQIKR